MYMQYRGNGRLNQETILKLTQALFQIVTVRLPREVTIYLHRNLSDEDLLSLSSYTPDASGTVYSEQTVYMYHIQCHTLLRILCKLSCAPLAINIGVNVRICIVKAPCI